MDAGAAIFLIRSLLQLGITAEQYRKAATTPDMTDEELKALISDNSSAIQELIAKDH